MDKIHKPYSKFNATEFIKNYIFQHRISLQSVSKKTSIRYELLRRSIYDGTRKLRADEFFEVIDALGIRIEFLGGEKNDNREYR